MLNKNSQEAMYIQIANILRAEIHQKIYSAGSSIGTHEMLSKRFDVSLITIRKAVDILLSEGLLVAQKGKGTFVASSPLQDSFNRLTGMSTVIAMNNVEAGVIVKNMKYITTPETFEEEVKSSLGTDCLYVERTHEANGKVIGYANIYIPKKYGDQFTIADVSNSTIYHLYENKIGLKLGKGVQIIRADKANSDVADALKISKGTPVLVIERKSYSKDKELIEFMVIYYNYEQYSFQVELDLFAD